MTRANIATAIPRTMTARLVIWVVIFTMIDGSLRVAAHHAFRPGFCWISQDVISFYRNKDRKAMANHLVADCFIKIFVG